MLKPLTMFVFTGLILLHVSLVLLMTTSWAGNVVWFTNIVSASLYLPSLLFAKIGLSVFEKGDALFPGFTFLGWFLLCLFWAIIYWSIARLVNRFSWACLTITLLKKWLVEFKFKDWGIHQTNQLLLNQPVTHEQKVARAEEIATMLSDNKLWHSHGRMIGISTLKTVLRLKIEDYSKDADLRAKILAYSDFLTDYISRHDYKHFLHSRCFFWHWETNWRSTRKRLVSFKPRAAWSFEKCKAMGWRT